MRLLVCASTLVLLAAAGPTRAGDPAVEQAKAHFAEAQKHFKLGRFDEALAEYTKAYEAKALPAFLFNIGQCHRKLERYDKAIHFYKSYLRDMPEAPNRKLVDDLISKSKQALEEQRKAEEERLASEEARKLEEQEQRERKAEEARLQAELEKARIQAEVEKAKLAAGEKDGDPPVYTTWWFWTIIGGVAAAGIAGGVVGGVLTGGGDTRTILPYGTAGTIDGRSR